MVLLWFLSGVLELSHTLASASKAAQHPLCPQPTLPCAPHWDVPPARGQKNLLWLPSVNQTIEPAQVKNNPGNPYSFSLLFWGRLFLTGISFEVWFTTWPVGSVVQRRWCSVWSLNLQQGQDGALESLKWFWHQNLQEGNEIIDSQQEKMWAGISLPATSVP